MRTLDRILVKKKQPIKQHDRLGLVGEAGDASAPHLHLAILVRGKNINPLGIKYVNTPVWFPEALRARFASLCEENGWRPWNKLSF